MVKTLTIHTKDVFGFKIGRLCKDFPCEKRVADLTDQVSAAY